MNQKIIYAEPGKKEVDWTIINKEYARIMNEAMTGKEVIATNKDSEKTIQGIVIYQRGNRIEITTEDNETRSLNRNDYTFLIIKK